MRKVAPPRMRRLALGHQPRSDPCQRCRKEHNKRFVAHVESPIQIFYHYSAEANWRGAEFIFYRAHRDNVGSASSLPVAGRRK